MKPLYLKLTTANTSEQEQQFLQELKQCSEKVEVFFIIGFMYLSINDGCKETSKEDSEARTAEDVIFDYRKSGISIEKVYTKKPKPQQVYMGRWKTIL